MTQAKYIWSKQEELRPDSYQTQIEALKAAGANYSPAFLRLCLNRGLTSFEAIQQATDPMPQTFHNPYDLYQMDLAVERIYRAIELEEQILIYGDYDADGVTSSLIVKETLDSLGAHSQVYLPNRFEDGYGPNLGRYREFIEAGTQLIITVDNGVAGHEAVEYAMNQGVDVIVTDHHEIQDSLPSAYAIIHPRHPQGHYPFGELAGAGVAFKLACALLDEIPMESLDLAAIGTVADMVSLKDENRTIVLSGLKLLQTTQRPGLKALLAANQGADQQIDTDTIGFIIGPRLNAVGRLSDPRPAFDLLSAFDDDQIKNHLQVVESENRHRQELVRKIFQDICQDLDGMDSLPLMIVKASPDWHPGVLGIVASRIVDKYQRPCLLFHEDDQKSVYKGSGRSVEKINLFTCLSQVKDHLLHFGGHAQAAGMTIEKDQWPAFCQAILCLAKEQAEAILTKASLQLDLGLSPEEVTVDLIREIDSLGPFGMDNPKPLILIKNSLIQEKNLIGVEKQHVKLQVSQASDQPLLTVLAFNQSESLAHFKPGNRISLVGELAINEWRQKQTPQLMLKDFDVEGAHWIDCRGSKLPSTISQIPLALYCFNHHKRADRFKRQIPESSVVNCYQEIKPDQMNKLHIERLVIMEPPSDLQDLMELLKYTWSEIYLGAYVSESRYLVGLPNRQEFGRLYHFCKAHPRFALKDLGQVGQNLGLPLIKVKTMIVVFFQANFVKIEDGFVTMNPIEQSKKVDLSVQPALLKYQKSMEAEALLNYQTLDQIIQKLYKGD